MKDTIIKIKVRQIIDGFHKNLENVDENDNLQRLGFDSVDFVKLVVEIENKFDIFVEDEDLLSENFDTINKITEYVENAL